MLSPEEQSVFAALAVFRGGFTREASAVVAGASIRDLARIAAKSLLVHDPDNGRYSVHELLRQYAQSELESQTDAHELVLEAHATYYSDLAEAVFELLPAGHEAGLLKIVEGDVDNIRSAWRYLLGANNPTAVRKMIGALFVTYEIRGWYQTGIALFDEALEALDDTTDESAAAHALSSAIYAWFLALLGQPTQAEGIAAAAVEKLRTVGTTVELLLAFQGLLITLVYQGKVDEWIAVTEEGIALEEELEIPFWAAVFRQWRGGRQ